MTDEHLQQLTLEANQALVILEHLQRWILGGPSRRVVLEAPDGEWCVSMETRTSVKTSGGETLRDALAQLASVVALDGVDS